LAILFNGPPKPEVCWNDWRKNKCEELIREAPPWPGFEVLTVANPVLSQLGYTAILNN